MINNNALGLLYLRKLCSKLMTYKNYDLVDCKYQMISYKNYTSIKSILSSVDLIWFEVI